MSLSPEDLREIANKVDDLSELDGVQVERIVVGNNKVMLDYKADRRTYSVVGITNGEWREAKP